MERIVRRNLSQRALDVLDAICLFAYENNGCVPTTRQLAQTMHLSQKRISYLMMNLEDHGRIAWLGRYQYKVIRASWEPPPDIGF